MDEKEQAIKDLAETIDKFRSPIPENVREELITSIIEYKGFDRAPTEWMVDKAILPLIAPLIEQAKKKEEERILTYLEYWWRSYEVTDDGSVSRHTFALPRDWKSAIRKGKPPYTKADWEDK